MFETASQPGFPLRFSAVALALVRHNPSDGDGEAAVVFACCAKGGGRAFLVCVGVRAFEGAYGFARSKSGCRERRALRSTRLMMPHDSPSALAIGWPDKSSRRRSITCSTTSARMVLGMACGRELQSARPTSPSAWRRASHFTTVPLRTYRADAPAARFRLDSKERCGQSCACSSGRSFRVDVPRRRSGLIRLDEQPSGSAYLEEEPDASGCAIPG